VGDFKEPRASVDAVDVFGIVPLQVPQERSLVLVQWPVPIVARRGGLIPFGVFALLFVVFSGYSEPSVLLPLALFGGIGGVVSLIVHELGHVSIARKLSGVRPEKVELMSLGAAAHFEGSYRSGREQARMALGGPEASFAFALALTVPVLLSVPGPVKVGALALALLNVAIGVLSLLPFHPLDGHKLIVGLVWSVVGSEAKARRIVKRIGMCLVFFDISMAVLLLAERPVLGAAVIGLAAVAFGQKHVLRRLTSA
jgi:Zn-dependent protease